MLSRFVRGGFRGLLPGRFGRGSDSTSTVVPAMNSKNVEEPSHYGDERLCEYVVEEDNGLVPRSGPDVLVRAPRLAELVTSTLSRALVVPFFTRPHFKSYVIRRMRPKEA